MSEAAQSLEVPAGGAEDPATRLLPVVYNELRKLAAARMAREPEDHTLQPTALVHEAWLRLVGSEPVAWQNRGHFFAAAAEAMRRILIERARRKARLKRDAGHFRVDLEEAETPAMPPEDEQILRINESLERLRTRDPEKARIVMLKFFGGLTNQEVAQSLGVTERTIERQWAFAKAWLFRDMQQHLRA